MLSNNNYQGKNVWKLANKGYLKFGPVAEMFFLENQNLIQTLFRTANRH